MLQLNPPLPMQTPKGEGYAHFVIDYGPESDLYWTVFITETGEVWTFANHAVRASKNITLGRTCANDFAQLQRNERDHDATDSGMAGRPVEAARPDGSTSTAKRSST